MKRAFVRVNGVSLCVALLIVTVGGKVQAEESREKAFWSSFKKTGLVRGVEAKLVKSLEKAAASEGMDLVDGRSLMECDEKECFVKAANDAGAEWILEIEIEVVGDTYMAEFKLFSVNEKVQWKKKSNCEICTFNEACSWFEKKLKTIFARAVKHGRADSDRKETVSLEEEREFEAAISLEDDLASSKTDAKIRKDSHRRTTVLKGMGWIFGGVSLLGFIPGAVLVAIDGKGTCSSPGECPEVYDTKTGGIISLAVGGACLVTAVTLYVFGVLKSRRGKEEVSTTFGDEQRFLAPVFSPGRDGTTFGVRGSF